MGCRDKITLIDYLQYIPRSKTIIKDCTILELLNGTYDLQNFLQKNEKNLSEDERACYLTLLYRHYPYTSVLNFRSLKIALLVLYEKQGIHKTIYQSDQLAGRDLDKNSSQWSTAKLLCGEDNGDKRYHVELARDVIRRWNNGERVSLFETKDDNYVRLFDYFLNNNPFIIDNCELAVFAVCLGMMKLEDGINMCPTWKHHESDRTLEIKNSMKQLMNQQVITTSDHRILIGITLRGLWLGMKPVFSNPECVKKSFPKFQEMLSFIYKKANIN